MTSQEDRDIVFKVSETMGRTVSVLVIRLHDSRVISITTHTDTVRVVIKAVTQQAVLPTHVTTHI